MVAQEQAIITPALRFFGGKWKLAPWIMAHFPIHDCYCEPYAGAANILLRKERSAIEVINDLNGAVINFFDVLRDRTDEFVRAIELTPFARAEYLRAQEPTADPLERARRFYVWAWQGRGRAGVIEIGGWRFMSRTTRTTPAQDFCRVAHLYGIAARLKGVQIESDTALRVINRYDTPTTLFYVDPPYVADTRGSRWGGSAYAFEMSDGEHCELAASLRTVQGMVVLSGYACPLYDEHLYSDWHRAELPTHADGKHDRVEILWLNEAAWTALERSRHTLPFTTEVTT